MELYKIWFSGRLHATSDLVMAQTFWNLQYSKQSTALQKIKYTAQQAPPIKMT